ncbi:MAG: hemagglutinin repeat-containing protein [Alphaproteobacteria bacterium]
MPINPVSNDATQITSSNNIPVLNVAKPSEAGVSVNKFNDFNVGQEGLIINNLNLQNYNFNYKSELSGEHIEFNRNFRDGEAAKVILNEVVSGNATSLLGTTEIYGRKADYIVANPNGITCAGCGFINTSRLSLITGSSNIKNGDIKSFTISPNAVLRIEGQGVGNLGLYSASSADLVSNVIKISGEIQTPEDLRIFQGDESFDWKNFSITSSEKIGSDIAVDVSALGGMKANNIYVVATGKGFGVNLGSDVVANGNIEITSAGEIKVKNAIANDNVIMKTPAKITADNGNIVANNILIDADNLENKSNIVATDNIYIDTKNEIKNIGKIKGNNLFLSANDIHNYGQILSNKDMEVMVANNLINYRASGILAGGNIWMKVANNLINYKADIYAGGDLSVEGRDDIDNNFVAVNPDTIYDNPYVEKEKDLGNVSGGNLSFAMDDDGEEALTFILKNGDEIQLPIDAFPDDAIAGAKYEYNGYTFILGTETITEKEIPNPEYEKCDLDITDCEDISKTVIKKIYSYSGTDDFTIKDSSGENISYTFGEEDFNDEIDDDIGVLNNTSVVQSNALNEYKNTFLDYDFSNNFFNNFVNLAGRIEAGGNIEINANNIVNKSFDINTGANGVSLYYDKIRDKVDGWRTAWKELGRYRISSVNLDGIAGAIVSGKNLILNAENILNQSSILSSKQNMILKSQSLSNITISDVVVLPIFMQRVSRKHGKKRRKNRTEYQTQRYYSKQRAIILAGGNLGIKSDVLKNDQDVNPTSGIVASVDNPNIVDGKISVEVNLPVGDNGLFKIADDGRYLVETNVPFIDARDYVGSDYFFDGKGALFNGVDTNKIIGDPAYETKLVMDAIVKATGEHYLKNNGSIGSDAEQMKALYDNALDMYEEFGLKVGVTLTQEQISALRNDIIWYVEREVGGQKVLVPELYLSQATLDSIDDNNGSKITGFNVGIESDFVSNYGDIKSENLLNVDAKTLLNFGNDENAAKLTSGGGVKINADNVLNLSGTISGKTVQVDADNIINQTKVLSDDYEGPNVKRHTEIAGSTSLISGENGVSLNAKNTLVNSGANIESSNGDVRISADTAVFDTVELFNREEKHTSSSSGISSKEKIEIKETRKNKSSEINAGGSLILSTSGDATFAGANVSVGGDALFDVGGQTNILDVKDTEFNYSKTTKSYAGGLYSKNDTVIDESERAKGTSVDIVNGLNIISRGDVNVVASDVNVGGDANILAGYSLTDEGVKKTDASSSVNILNDTETTRHYEKHEKSNFVELLTDPDFDFSASGGKLNVSAEVGEKSSHEEETISKNVVSSNLNVGGNLQIGATDNINITASNLIGGMTLLGTENDINITDAKSTTNKTSVDKETKITAGVSVGNAYVDAALAAQAFYEAGKAVDDAKSSLNRIKEARDRGEASDEVVKDAEFNLSMAMVNLVNAELAMTSSIAGAATAAGTSFGTGVYASASLNYDTSKHTETSETSTSVGSNIMGENIVFKSGNNMTQIGSNVVADNTVSYDIMNKLSVIAGENTYRSESSDEHISAGASVGNNSVQVNAGYDKASNRASGTNYTNSNIVADNIIVKTGGDSEFIGANVNANENLIMSVGGDLKVESKQDTDYAKGSNFGVSISGGNGTGKNSGGGGFNTGKSNHDSAWVNDQTELTAKNVDITVEGKSTLVGGLIDGSESLNLTTNELEYKDLVDFDKSSESGFGFNTSVGVSTDKGKTSLHPNGSTTITMRDKGSEKEQITHATIGSGNITVGGKTNSDLEGLNRDVSKAQEITKDKITGALDGSMTIDNRVFSGEGWRSIIEDHTNLVGNTIKMAAGITNTVVNPFVTAYQVLTNDKIKLNEIIDVWKSNAVAGANTIRTDRKIINNLSDGNQNVNDIQKATEDERVKIYYDEEDDLYGKYDKDNRTIYINGANGGATDTDTFVRTYGHESSHEFTGNDDISDNAGGYASGMYSFLNFMSGDSINKEGGATNRDWLMNQMSNAATFMTVLGNTIGKNNVVNGENSTVVRMNEDRTKGTIIDAKADGDKNIYDENGEVVGQTLFDDSFIKYDKNGELVGPAYNNTIHFDKDLTDYINGLVKEAALEIAPVWLFKSRKEGTYDIKNKLAETIGGITEDKWEKHYDGALFNGDVVSFRGAGNILVGMNSENSIISNSKLDFGFDMYQYISNGVYRETEEAYKHINYGRNLQKSSNEYTVDKMTDYFPSIKDWYNMKKFIKGD